MVEKIIELRAQGKSYRAIEKILGCSRGLISYHCGDKQKQKTVHRTNVLRRKRKELLVAYKGGKCEKCGYNKSIVALDFHHVNPKEKDFSIGDCKHVNIEILKREVDKCLLLCANCHREQHENNL